MSQRFFVGRAVGLLALLVIVGAVLLFMFLNSYIYNQKQATGQPPEPYRATLAGEYVCLPHVDDSGPETFECAFGIKTTVGDYYAIDFALMSQEHKSISIGDRISAAGLITPIELLSTDHWRQYPIEGIFSVTDSLEVIE